LFRLPKPKPGHSGVCCKYRSCASVQSSFQKTAARTEWHTGYLPARSLSSPSTTSSPATNSRTLTLLPLMGVTKISAGTEPGSSNTYLLPSCRPTVHQPPHDTLVDSTLTDLHEVAKGFHQQTVQERIELQMICNTNINSNCTCDERAWATHQTAQCDCRMAAGTAKRTARSPQHPNSQFFHLPSMCSASDRSLPAQPNHRHMETG
jgi:hypothetical protein